MKCLWTQLLAVLPAHMKSAVDALGRDGLQELRLRLDTPPLLVMQGGTRVLPGQVTREDISHVINTASRYSPWTAATAARGYITAPGGHRIGLCGQCAVQNGAVTGMRDVISLCIRVARDFPGLARAVPGTGSVLILGPPGSGKTTLLRDLIRQTADRGTISVAVVDERGELFPAEAGFAGGKNVDVLTGCDKKTGVDMVLRTMGPGCIAVDEITSREDCEGLLQAGWCGVRLLATAHAGSLADLRARPVYRPLVEAALFDTAVVLKADRSWTAERMKL